MNPRPELQRRPAWLDLLRRFPLAVALAAAPATGRAATLAITGGNQHRSLTAADLAGGAGSDFSSPLDVGTTFTLEVTSSGPCKVWVRRTSGSWLTAGDLMLQLKSGGTFGPGLLVDLTDRLLLSSDTALTAQSFELRYSLHNVTVANAPGTYAASITFTVTEG